MNNQVVQETAFEDCMINNESEESDTDVMIRELEANGGEGLITPENSPQKGHPEDPQEAEEEKKEEPAQEEERAEEE